MVQTFYVYKAAVALRVLMEIKSQGGYFVDIVKRDEIAIKISRHKKTVDLVAVYIANLPLLMIIRIYSEFLHGVK